MVNYQDWLSLRRSQYTAFTAFTAFAAFTKVKSLFMSPIKGRLLMTNADAMQQFVAPHRLAFDVRGEEFIFPLT